MDLPRPGTSCGRGASDSDRSVRVRERVQAALGADRFDRYFGGGARLEAAPGRVEVSVPSPFMAELISRRFASILREAGEPAGREPVEIAVRVDRDLHVATKSAPVEAGKPSRGVPRARPARYGRLRHRLDTFVVGQSNRLAHSAAERVAEGVEDRAFCPLFIHGLSGVGKTHLLQGIAARFGERLPGAVVRYVTAESFTNEFITAVRANRIDRFRRAWRSVRLLCLDDVHFVAGKEGTQQELLHTLDALDLDEARLVLASDEHPRAIERLGSHLSSRFMSGAVIRVDPPEETLRRRLILRIAQDRGLVLDDDAVGIITHRASTMPSCTVREIEGMLTQVMAVQRLAPEVCGTSGVLDAGAVRRAFGLSDGSHRRGSRAARRTPVRFEGIAENVCRALAVTMVEVQGSGRHRRVVLARRVMIRLARELTTLSFPEIARQLKRPSHSTVVTAHRTVCGQIEAGECVQVGDGAEPIPIAELIAAVRTRVLDAAGR